MAFNLLEILCEYATRQGLQNKEFTFTAEKFTKKQEHKINTLPKKLFVRFSFE